MWNRLRARGGMVLAAGIMLCGILGGEASGRHPPIKPPKPPKVEKPPPGTTTEEPPGGHDNGGGGTPPGTTQNMPEPATLVSALIGVGLAGLYGSRRRKKLPAAE